MKLSLVFSLAMILAAGSAMAGKSACPHQSKGKMKSSDFSWALPGGKPQNNKQTPVKKGIKEASVHSTGSAKKG